MYDVIFNAFQVWVTFLGTEQKQQVALQLLTISYQAPKSNNEILSWMVYPKIGKVLGISLEAMGKFACVSLVNPSIFGSSEGYQWQLGTYIWKDSNFSLKRISVL